MNKNNKKKINAVDVLTGAALGLSSLTMPVQAVEFVSNPELDLQFSQYSEDDIQLSDGAVERYDIPSVAAKLVLPLRKGAQISLKADFETMSGASPRLLQQQGDSAAVIMSGASKIEDSRKDLLFSLQLGDQTRGFSYALGVSNEDDYQAFNLGVEHWFSWDANNQTLRLAASISDDKVTPVAQWGPSGVISEDRHEYNIQAAYARVLNKNAQFKTTFLLSEQGGYLDDPYKRVANNGVEILDQRPDERLALSVLNQLRVWVDAAQAAMHLDYRFYRDSWDVQSHTLTMRWAQSLNNSWLVTPELRYYAQSEAEFYAPYFLGDTPDGFYSSDFRLSPYGAISAKLSVEKSYKDFSWRVSFERYDSDADYSLNRVAFENPALVDFDVFSFGIKKRFK